MRAASSSRMLVVILGACAALMPEFARTQLRTPESGWKFLPESNRFRPLAANWQEARLGIRKQAGSSRMRLDIGASIDLVAFTRDSAHGIELRAGVEFFAYGLSTSVRGLRLQIDALDGHFGGSVSLFAPAAWGILSARLRLLHLSSHFVDGHVLGNWVSIDGRAPTAFTRDFGELVIAPEFSSADWFVRPYAGVSYSTLVRPDDLARWGGLFGGEIFFHLFPGQLFGRPAALYAAVHNALEGNPDPAVTSSFEAGIHVGGRQGAAVRLFAGFFNGNEVFHQYYKERMQYWTMGIAFEVR